MDVRLQKEKLWREFHALENEMIVLPKGRQLFPCLEYKFYKLEPKTLYHCSLTFLVTDNKKYRFSNAKWDEDTTKKIDENIHYPREVFIGKPMTGTELMRKSLSCEKIKISNRADKTTKKNEVVRVQSMRKYMPVLSVYRLTNDPMCPMVMLGQYKYPETQFIAVTAYQRERITDLKVLHNPFAQGFRDRKRESTSPLLSGTPSCSSDDSPQSRKSGMTTPANDENIGGMDQLQMQQQIQIQQQQQQMMMMNPFGVVQQQQQQYQTNQQQMMNVLQPNQQHNQQGYFNNNPNMPMYTPQYGFDMQQYNYDQFYNPNTWNWGAFGSNWGTNTEEK